MATEENQAFDEGFGGMTENQKTQVRATIFSCSQSDINYQIETSLTFLFPDTYFRAKEGPSFILFTENSGAMGSYSISLSGTTNHESLTL